MKNYKFSILFLFTFSLFAMDGPINIPLINKEKELQKVTLMNRSVLDLLIDYRNEGDVVCTLAMSSLFACCMGILSLEPPGNEIRCIICSCAIPCLCITGIVADETCFYCTKKLLTCCDRESEMEPVNIPVSKKSLSAVVRLYKNHISKEKQNRNLISV